MPQTGQQKFILPQLQKSETKVLAGPSSHEGSRGKSAPCPSLGCGGCRPSSACTCTTPVSAPWSQGTLPACLHMSSSSLQRRQSRWVSFLQSDLILTSLPLQGTYFQMRSHPERPEVRTPRYLLRGVQFTHNTLPSGEPDSICQQSSGAFTFSPISEPQPSLPKTTGTVFSVVVT